MEHQNELRDGVSDLARKEFTPMHMRDDNLIFADHAVQSTESHPDGTTPST